MAKNELEFSIEDLVQGLGNPEISDNFSPELDLKPETKEESTEEVEEKDEFEDFDINKQLATKEQSTEESKETSEKPLSDVGLEETKNTDSYALAFARYQLERGNLTDLNEEEFAKIVEEQGEDEAISWLFQSEVDKNREAIRNEILDQYEDDVKEFLKLRDNGIEPDIAGDLATAKKFYSSLNTDELEDDSKESLRSKIITDWYKRTTKFNDARIKKLVENHVALGEDVDVAKEAVGEVKNIISEQEKELTELTKKQQKEFEDNHKKQLEELRSKIDSMDEILPNHKINKQTKDKLHDMLVKPVAQDQYGNPINSIWKKRMSDPFKFDTMVAYLDILGVFDGKMDKLLKPAKNSAVSDLERSLKSQNFGSKPATGSRQDSDDLAKGLASALGIK